MCATTDGDILEGVDQKEKDTLHSLNTFLENWDNTYNRKVNTIPMFNDKMTTEWNTEQKQFFVKTFYHVRGHFHDFLWHMGNHAPDKKSKDIILFNIAEEFGAERQSHEKLYMNFAKCLVTEDIYDEIKTQNNYLPYIKEFNNGHIKWLIDHDWEECLSAFSAYERLDNVDYNNLMRLVRSLGVTEKDALFFTVHMYVEHFESTLLKLLEIWKNNKEKVINAFNFIATHQIHMWENLSRSIFEYRLEKGL